MFLSKRMTYLIDRRDQLIHSLLIDVLLEDVTSVEKFSRRNLEEALEFLYEIDREDLLVIPMALYKWPQNGYLQYSLLFVLLAILISPLNAEQFVAIDNENKINEIK